MKLNVIKGDRTLWILIVLASIGSCIAIYSVSANTSLVSFQPFRSLWKQAMIFVLGISMVFIIHRVPYNVYRGVSVTSILLIIGLLIYTAFQGTTIGGASASRWIRLPLVNISIQSSLVAAVFLIIYVVNYLNKFKDKDFNFKSSIIWLWLPVFSITILIFTQDISTAILLLGTILTTCFVGSYPLKNLVLIICSFIAIAFFYILLTIAFPSLPGRSATGLSRISLFSNEQSAEGDQIEKAKMAIASGGFLGKGSGKSVMKNHLAASNTDFIYSIVIEEFGFLGGISIVFFYILLLWRIWTISHHAKSHYGKLLTFALGFLILFQAFIHLCVNLDLIPVTGQPLPLFSSGGSSILMTLFALGIIISVSVKDYSPKELDEKENNNPIDILSGTV